MTAASPYVQPPSASISGSLPFYDTSIAVTQDNITVSVAGHTRIRVVAELVNANASTIQQRLEFRDASHATVNSMVMLFARVNSGTGGAKTYSSTFPFAFLGAVSGLTTTIDMRLFVGTGRAKGTDGKEVAISQLDPVTGGGTIYDDSYSLICTDTTTAVNELYFFGYNGGVVTAAIGAGSRIRVWDD